MKGGKKRVKVGKKGRREERKDERMMGGKKKMKRGKEENGRKD